MAFELNNLSQIGPGGTSPRLWTYATDESLSSVIAADYFLPAIDLLKENDVIMIVRTGETKGVTFTFVNDNDGTTIDVVDGLAIPTTDT